MEIVKIKENDPLIKQLISMSKDWENEKSCEGYFSNNEETFKNKDIYVVLNDNEVIAYLYGYIDETNRTNTIHSKGQKVFEVDEIFVCRNYRNMSIGTKLFNYVENDVKDKVDIILLSTATKDYKKILHFYIDELDMTFWNARLYKRTK